MNLQTPEPPRLPDPEPSYGVLYMRQLLNVFRLYFNRLTGVFQALLGTKGGTYIQTFYGQFFATATQTAASPNTAYAVAFDTTSMRNGVDLSGGSLITVDARGVYMATLSLQLANAAVSLYRVDVWFEQNGVLLSNSNSRYSVTESHGGAPGHMATEVVVFLEMDAGDTLECFWSTEDTDVNIEYTAAAGSPSRPATPSAILTVNLISALPGA